MQLMNNTTLHLLEPAGPLLTPRVALLRRLRGKGRHRYRRYDGLPLRYAGGKSLAVGHVVEHLPEGLDSIVSPFFGGGSVEIACGHLGHLEEPRCTSVPA